MYAQHQKCAYNLCETKAELANSSVERTFFLQRTKEEEKICVSNGMKPRTQILDKTQKKKKWKWTSGMGLHKIHTSLCCAGPRMGGGTSRVKQPYKQQKGWPF